MVVPLPGTTGRPRLGTQRWSSHSGSDLPPHTWRGTTTSVLMNLPILTSPASARIDNYQWVFKFLWSLLDNQPLGPNCKRHKTDQKANLRSNGAWRSRLFSILQWWYEHWVLVAPIARASGFGGRVDMQCDTTTSFDGFLEGNRLMIHVASKQKPSRTGQLHSKRPSAAAAACLRTNSIREHYVIYIYQ